MRYQKRPVIVEAEQWFPGKLVKGVWGWQENARRCIACLPEGSYEVIGPSVITIQGRVIPISSGEWVIMESDGIHAYPCDPVEFDRLYEPAGDGSGSDDENIPTNTNER